MAFWQGPPLPPTKLGHYRTLSPLASIHVSPLQLGAMSIGDKWGALGMGAMDKESSFNLLDAYFDNGGNFMDTANNYQDESSESFIGEGSGISLSLRPRSIHPSGHPLCTATDPNSQYTTNFKDRNKDVANKITYVGNNIKSMHISVEASLKKLRTTYIDILYVHWWDWDTGVKEVMDGLHNLVVQGKVLYLGVSDTPAWIFSQANQYAIDHGKSLFVIDEGAWNVMERSFEREIIPMARAHGLALAPWNVLASGKLRTDAEEERRRQTGEKGRTLVDPMWERTKDQKKMSRALEKVAGEVGTKSITADTSCLGP
ncbi:Aldo/keto reductase [Mycena venus]|uniref:Aldo/keto reductase n=1 Tax=Mycena venus TaxID=2733690 RepID=A0A8H7CD19_9AGAR|nr:Aldo/keto reductase [Mycena venus]